VDRVRYQRLAVLADNTDSLGRRGTVRLRLPDAAGSAEPFGDWTAASFTPPDPDLLGIGELPPRIDNAKLAERVLGWIRVSRADPSHPPVRLRWIDANVVRVEQAITAAAELLGYGDGRTGQRHTLSRTPVIPGSPQVQVFGPLGWENWQVVEDLALAGPDDPFYTLDPADGSVTFGDGMHGRIPLPGEAIRCLTYKWRRRARQRGRRAHQPGVPRRPRRRPGPEGRQPAAGRVRRRRRDPARGQRTHPRGAAPQRPGRGQRRFRRTSPWKPPACRWAAPTCCPATSPTSGWTACPAW
jgi:hypothetical protein